MTLERCSLSRLNSSHTQVAEIEAWWCESKEWGQDRGKIGPSWQNKGNLMCFFISSRKVLCRCFRRNARRATLKVKARKGLDLYLDRSELFCITGIVVQRLWVIWEVRGELEQMARVPLGEQRLPQWTLGALDHLDWKAMSSIPLWFPHQSDMEKGERRSNVTNRLSISSMWE